MGRVIVTNLKKSYRQYPQRWFRLLEWLSFGIRKFHTNKVILNDVSFEISSGEAVGIIGINGAGKSTLLKLITGTTQATSGTVEVTGKVAAMLELGMGFHPDFTGRQNALMAGQLMGMSRDEIESRMQEIETFSGIGSYIDQPVRVYSSGMQVRLAFSVAISRRPDILIVDEALAVGDAIFQGKCYDKIREFQKLGTTLIFVSHDLHILKSLCQRAIIINDGIVNYDGKPQAAADIYNLLISDKTYQRLIFDSNSNQDSYISGSGELSVTDVGLYIGSQKSNVLSVGQKALLCIDILGNSPAEDIVVGFVIKDRAGIELFGINTHSFFKNSISISKNQTRKITFNLTLNMGPGEYTISVAVHKGESHVEKNYVWLTNAYTFTVINNTMKRFVGMAWLDANVVNVDG